MRPNTLSASLNVLFQAGLVSSRRDGRSVIYTAAFDRIATLMGFLAEDCCAGAPDVCRPLGAVLARVACCNPDTLESPS